MEVKLRLKEWLIAQIDSGQFAGLSWENEEKTMFRIPWKHAAKQDYKPNEDAALFKAWAVHKGKYREGRDKDDPTMWKTRLRCALNKSTDFQEVPENNQLDISEPYKVYRILADTNRDSDTECLQAENPPRNPGFLQPPQLGCGSGSNKGSNTVNANEALREHMYCSVTGEAHPSCASPSTLMATPVFSISDHRMLVRVYYHGQLVRQVMTSNPDGCFILQGRVPLGSEKIYGPCNAEQLSFPSPASIPMPEDICNVMTCLLSHLDRGVLLWVAPDGVFIKRFCQGRVYWSGPLAPHMDRPNKLDQERTCKLLDMPIFLKELHNYFEGVGPIPNYKIELCFGEDFPNPMMSTRKKLILVQVIPMFAEGLLKRSQQGELEERPPTGAVPPKKEEL